jgi:hypothetical protein
MPKSPKPNNPKIAEGSGTGVALAVLGKRILTIVNGV